jgi:hypothetical protein
MKIAFKGRRFQDVEDVKKNVIPKLNAVPLDAFDDSFVQLLERWTKFIAAMVGYF